MYKAKINNSEPIEIDLSPDSRSVTINGETREIDFEILEGGHIHLIDKDRSRLVHVVKKEGKQVLLSIDGETYDVTLEDEHDLLLKSLGFEAGAGAAQKDLKAPMPGLVLDILVSPGQSVGKDEPLIILEAMKMENVIKATGDQTVKAVPAEKGKAVEKNEILIEFE